MTSEQTKILSYLELTPAEIGHRQRQILDALRERGISSNRELSEFLGLPINCITPRVMELRKLGIVISNGTDFDYITGRTVTKWRALV